jgi:hypothetical protein
VVDYQCRLNPKLKEVVRKEVIKLLEAGDAGRITTQLGTPRGRYDEHSSKSFPQ